MKISDNYTFYAGFLKFVSAKIDKSNIAINVMMRELDQAAMQIENAENFSLLTRRAEVTSRAFAGVAHFLQDRILPEAQAHGDQTALSQLQWAIAASLQIGRAIILYKDQAEKNNINQEFIEIKLPPLDRIPGMPDSIQTETLH